MSLQARDIILSSWEEQMGWFLPDNNNSLWFWLSAMKFVLKMLSWSNKPGARWAYHLSCTTLHQNKFWQILQECVIFRSNKRGISNSKNNGIKLCSMLMDLLQFPLQMHFLMKKKFEKPMPSTGETDGGTFFKAWLQWQVLSHLRKAGEGGAGSLLSARLTFPPWKEWWVPIRRGLDPGQRQGPELWGCLLH